MIELKRVDGVVYQGILRTVSPQVNNIGTLDKQCLTVMVV